MQLEDGRFIVRGANGREHVFEPTGKELVTSVNRSHSAHLERMRQGIIRSATDDEFAAFKEAINE